MTYTHNHLDHLKLLVSHWLTCTHTHTHTHTHIHTHTHTHTHTQKQTHTHTHTGVQGAARCFSDLVKRYKGAEGGGLIPKKFVTEFLWEAKPQEYTGMNQDDSFTIEDDMRKFVTTFLWDGGKFS